MCAMALLHRAKALSKYKQSHQSSSKSGQGLARDTQLPPHVRMPASFIGTSRRVMWSLESAVNQCRKSAVKQQNPLCCIAGLRTLGP